MPNDRADRPAQETAPISVPDQLQQAQQPEAPRVRATPADQQAGRDEAAAGILHELKTERAHD